MATKIYITNGAINVDDGVNALVVINPRHFDWSTFGSIYRVRDKIDNQTTDLGILSNIQNENGASFSSATSLTNYLNGLMKGVSDVALQDQTTPDVILWMNRVLGAIVLDGVQTRDSFSLAVEAGHGATAGEWVCIQQYDEVYSIPRFYQAEIVVANATDLEMDRPIDFAFDPAEVLCSNRVRINMANEVGSVATPILYKISPKSGVWDITRIIPQFFTAGTMDDGKFGSISSLTHGITLRRKNGFWYNSWNFKNNGEWASIAYDSKYADKPPAGTGNGFSGRLTWAGQNKIGVVKRLWSALASGRATDDSLEMVIPNSLAAFGADDFIGFKVEGHVVMY